MTAQDIALARELGLRASPHVGVGSAGRQSRAMKRMHENGVLGPDLLHVHCNQLSEDEYKMLADSGGAVTVSASVEPLTGLGFSGTGRLLRHGIRPGLDVDVVAATGGDMFNQMKVALAAERARNDQETIERDEKVERVTLATRDVLEFATIEGARACGLDDRIGTLTPGKQADLVLLRADRLNRTPLNDAGAAVATAADVSNVDSVIVAGRPLKRGGALVDVDLARVRRLAHETRDWLFAEAGWSTDPVTPIEE